MPVPGGVRSLKAGASKLKTDLCCGAELSTGAQLHFSPSALCWMLHCRTGREQEHVGMGPGHLCVVGEGLTRLGCP